MFRLSILLLILAVGLAAFIWVNPPARERAEAAWDTTRTFFVELYAQVAPSAEK